MKQEKDRSKLKTKKWGHVVQIGNKKKKLKLSLHPQVRKMTVTWKTLVIITKNNYL